MSVSPSGRFPSVRERPTGSLLVGMLALTSARYIRSFSVLWRAVLPKPSRQEKLWDPETSTSEPQGHLGVAQRSTPSRKPTAIRMASSSSLRPQEETGTAWSHSPLCGADAAARRRFDTGSSVLFHTVALSRSMPGRFQADCRCEEDGSGMSQECRFDQA